MRRAISIALMLVLGLPLFAPAFALGQATGRLPVCCRRGGVHHCMEMGTPATGAGPMVRGTCPAYPQRAAAVQGGVWAVAGGHLHAAGMVVDRAMVGQVEAGYRISSGRARQKRGPPAQS